MRDLEKDNINKIFKDKKLKWCGNFFGHDDIGIPGFGDECYEFTFQITDIKPMISVGELYDYAVVDVTVYLKDTNFLTKIVSKGTHNTLMPFLYFKNSLRETIIKTLKPISDLKVMVTSINPVIEKTENINESKMYRSVMVKEKGKNFSANNTNGKRKKSDFF